ncbi:hypothetical protein HDU93_002230 [Gonapodya sp. JEL0774]|nr:hypothetical protein HDU93_002230 [Gonapodya sp. JEL0774]
MEDSVTRPPTPPSTVFSNVASPSASIITVIHVRDDGQLDEDTNKTLEAAFKDSPDEEKIFQDQEGRTVRVTRRVIEREPEEGFGRRTIKREIEYDMSIEEEEEIEVTELKPRKPRNRNPFNSSLEYEEVEEMVEVEVTTVHESSHHASRSSHTITDDHHEYGEERTIANNKRQSTEANAESLTGEGDPTIITPGNLTDILQDQPRSHISADYFSKGNERELDENVANAEELDLRMAAPPPISGNRELDAGIKDPSVLVDFDVLDVVVEEPQSGSSPKLEPKSLEPSVEESSETARNVEVDADARPIVRESEDAKVTNDEAAVETEGRPTEPELTTDDSTGEGPSVLNSYNAPEQLPAGIFEEALDVGDTENVPDPKPLDLTMDFESDGVAAAADIDTGEVPDMFQSTPQDAPDQSLVAVSETEGMSQTPILISELPPQQDNTPPETITRGISADNIRDDAVAQGGLERKSELFVPPLETSGFTGENIKAAATMAETVRKSESLNRVAEHVSELPARTLRELQNSTTLDRGAEAIGTTEPEQQTTNPSLASSIMVSQSIGSVVDVETPSVPTATAMAAEEPTEEVVPVITTGGTTELAVLTVPDVDDPAAEELAIPGTDLNISDAESTHVQELKAPRDVSHVSTDVVPQVNLNETQFTLEQSEQEVEEDRKYEGKKLITAEALLTSDPRHLTSHSEQEGKFEESANKPQKKIRDDFGKTLNKNGTCGICLWIFLLLLLAIASVLRVKSRDDIDAGKKDVWAVDIGTYATVSVKDDVVRAAGLVSERWRGLWSTRSTSTTYEANEVNIVPTEEDVVAGEHDTIEGAGTPPEEVAKDEVPVNEEIAAHGEGPVKETPVPEPVTEEDQGSEVVITPEPVAVIEDGYYLEFARKQIDQMMGFVRQEVASVLGAVKSVASGWWDTYVQTSE